jgi:branched-chain amino acid transport system substrate-binding protein
MERFRLLVETRRPTLRNAIILLALVGATLAAACASSVGGGGGSAPSASADPYGVVRVKKGDTIRIGNSGPLSGPNATLGKEQQDAAQLVLDQRSTVKDFKVELVSGDDGCTDASSATAVANQFVSDERIVGVIGTTCSSGMLASLPIYTKAHYVMISPSATNGKLPKQGSDMFFRVAWNDDNQGPEQADYVKNTLKKSKIAVLHDDSAYGEGLVATFDSAYQDAGHQIVYNEEIKAGQPDYSSFVSRLKATNPDMVYYSGYAPEAATLLRELHGEGVTVPFLAGDGVRDPALVDKAGKDAEGAYLTQLTGGTSSKTTAFDDAYKTKYGNLDGAYLNFTADATNIMLDAIDKVAQVDPKTGDLLIGRKALRDAVAATSYEGATGTVSFIKDGDREPSQLKLDVAIVKDGKFVPAT